MGNAIVQDLMDQLSSVDAALQALEAEQAQEEAKEDFDLESLNCKVKTSPGWRRWRWKWWKRWKPMGCAFMGGDDDDDEVQKSSSEREIANVKIPIKHRATTRNNTNPFWQKCMI